MQQSTIQDIQDEMFVEFQEEQYALHHTERDLEDY